MRGSAGFLFVTGVLLWVGMVNLLTWGNRLFVSVEYQCCGLGPPMGGGGKLWGPTRVQPQTVQLEPIQNI